MSQYEYKVVPIKDLIPYANNSRTHTDEQINQIAASMEEFGFTNPVLIDEDNGIIAGHGRVLGAEKNNIDDAPCIVLAGLTKAQKKAYVIADNQLALNADWDFDALKSELESLSEMEFDTDILGFDDGFLEGLLNDGEKTQESPAIFRGFGEQELSATCPKCGFEFDA